ncbi:hypothetical protein ACF3NG_07695 [Aerococcaceae bacterium WGS1372]
MSDNQLSFNEKKEIIYKINFVIVDYSNILSELNRDFFAGIINLAWDELEERYSEEIQSKFNRDKSSMTTYIDLLLSQKSSHHQETEWYYD